MANRSLPQATWNGTFRKFGHFAADYHLLDETRKRFQKARAQVIEDGDTTTELSSWTYRNDQVPLIGTDTDEDAKMYFTISDETPGAGQARIQIYKDSGKSNEVLRGTGSDGGTVNFLIQNSSFGGYTGTVATVVMGSITASITSIVYENFVDGRKRVSDNFSTTEEEIRAKSAYLNATDNIVADVESAKLEVVSAFESWLITDLKPIIGSSSDIPIDTDARSDDGAVSITRSGLLYDLNDAMADDGNAGSQTVLQMTTSNTTPVWDTQNTGSGTITSLVVREYGLDGTFNAICTDATIGSEFFSCTLARSDGGATVGANFRAKVKKLWDSADLGVSFKIERVYTTTGTGAGQFASWALTGETDSNSDDGVYYLDLSSSGTFYSLTLFSASSRATDKRVANGTRTGNGTVTLSAVNGSGLTGSVVLTYSADTAAAEVDLNVFKRDDAFTFTVTNNLDAKINSFLALVYGYSLRSLTSGSETIDDSYASASSLPPYE
jgi:hypothetical protein